jgi:hypothetical protein
MKQFKRIQFSAFLVVAAAGVANASTLNATFNNVSPNDVVSLSLDGGSSYNSYYAGVMDWTKTGGDYAGVSGDFTTFCIEITEHVGFGGAYSFTMGDPSAGPTSFVGGMGVAKAALLSELYGRYYNTTNFSINDNAAAFQIAVWEIVNDADTSLSAGDFRVQNNGAYYTTAQNWLNSLNGTGPTMHIDAMLANGVQDQIVVPEPASLCMMLLSALPLLRRRRLA